MTRTASKTNLKTIAFVATMLSIGFAQTASALNNGGGLGESDDCYNRVTRACNDKYPGQTYGDAQYKACIDNGLDQCDINEPVPFKAGKLKFLGTKQQTMKFVPAR